MSSSLTWIDPLLRKESSITARLTGTPRTFYSSYPWSSGYSNDPSSFASFITDAILLGMDLYILSSYKHGKKNSPKWFNSQCTKAVNSKNHTSRNGSDFKPNIKELLSSTHATPAPKQSKMPNHLLSNASTRESFPARLALAPFGLW